MPVKNGWHSLHRSAWISPPLVERVSKVAPHERVVPRYDVVILDPPSFSSARGRPFSVVRDYQRLVAAAARCTAHRGMLLAATNHAGTTTARFEAWLRDGLEQAHPVHPWIDRLDS